ncbi:MAG: SDR family oxidoreductase [Planctomycetes bacterium]|nr:SDR family oxidoreductase [Planctomycetota bacterium]
MTSNNTCLIIGAAGGIGRALADLLAEAGWHLVLAGRTESSLRRISETYRCPLSLLDAAKFDAVDAVFQDHPTINTAVNLAGSILLKPAHSTTSDEFDATVSQNLRTSFSLVRAAGKHMKASGGSVVLMSSCAATIGLANHEAIAAAKAGVEGLVRSAAATYAAAGVRFNAVAPGLVDTPMAERITRNEASLKASVAMHPLGRIGTPVEIARMIAFLLSPQNGWITGQVFGVDGGLGRVKGRG